MTRDAYLFAQYKEPEEEEDENGLKPRNLGDEEVIKEVDPEEEEDEQTSGKRIPSKKRNSEKTKQFYMPSKKTPGLPKDQGRAGLVQARMSFEKKSIFT